MRRPFIFTSLGVVRGESKRGNRKCGPENTLDPDYNPTPRTEGVYLQLQLIDLVPNINTFFRGRGVYFLSRLFH